MKLKGKHVAVIGGCGHVGLPLGVKFAQAGAKTTLIDISQESVAFVNSGRFPFIEKGGDEQLRKALESGLSATVDCSCCADAEVIVFVTGTPVDEHLNPKIGDVLKIFDFYAQYFSSGNSSLGKLIVMRSTLFPGTMQHIFERCLRSGLEIRLAFCPERVAQGVALDEIDSLPQIVSAFDEPSFEAAYQLFSAIAPEIIRLTPLEAEMCKLMANSWRYLEFAIANQFLMIAESAGVDFQRVYQAIRYDYPRAAAYKSPGFAAGPCLFKDTMQLASFFDNKFYMGHAAMLVNEGLATFVVERAVAINGGPLWGKTVGLLGLSFKAENDDLRESLSFKVKKGLEFKGAEVLAHDPYVKGVDSLERVLAESDILILCTPHQQYKQLVFTQPVVDVWGIYKQAQLEILPGNSAK